MNIPPHQLDEALRRVQQGLMQPDEAAKWLLAQSATEASHVNRQTSRSLLHSASNVESSQPTTIADLLDQLGEPPDSIQRDWDEQLAALAHEFERSTGRSLSKVSINDILVDSNNRLSLSSAMLAEPPSLISNDAHAVSKTSVRLSHDKVSLGSRPTTTVSKAETPSNDERNPKPKKKSTNKRNLFSKHGWIQPTAVLFVAALAIGLTFYFLIDSNESSLVETPSSGGSIFSPTTNDHNAKLNSQTSNPPLNRRKDLPAVDSPSAELKLADDLPSMTPSNVPPSTVYPPSRNTTGEESASSRAMLGLDSFAGGNWGSGVDLLPAADFDTNALEVDAPNSMPVEGDVDAVDESSMTSAEQAEDTAPDSPIRLASGATSIELPAIPTKTMADEEIEAISIAKFSVDKVEMLFPSESLLSLANDNENWVVKDNKDQSTLATFVAGENDLQFRWAAPAATRPIAKQLTSALLILSIRDGITQPLFLRPEVTADAWPIDLTTGDAKAAWPITTPPPIGPASLNIKFHVPETVIQTWVLPHDPAHVRRSQSMVEFTLGSDSKIAIRSRLELKTGTRITLRMRHAAQLDPSFPWQMISTTKVQDAIEQIANQLAQAMAEQERVKIIYSKASSTEKRFLLPHRDSIDSVVLRLRDLSARLTKYDQLLSQLDHHAHMTINLDVAWPVSAPLTNQVIFAMNSPPGSNP